MNTPSRIGPAMVKAFRLVSSNPGISMTVAAKRLSSFGEAGKGRRPIRRAIAAGMLRLDDDGMRLYAAPETRWQSSGYLKAGKNRAERSDEKSLCVAAGRNTE